MTRLLGMPNQVRDKSSLLLGVSVGVLVLCLLHQPIKVADVMAVLDNAELLELAQGVLVGLDLGDAASAVEDLAVGEAKERVEACGPVLHRHRDLTAGARLSQIEKGVDAGRVSCYYLIRPYNFCLRWFTSKTFSRAGHRLAQRQAITDRIPRIPITSILEPPHETQDLPSSRPGQRA